jgi:hypothetical protein
MQSDLVKLIGENRHNLVADFEDECLLVCKVGNYKLYFTTAVCINDRVYYDTFILKQNSVNFPAPNYILDSCVTDDEQKMKIAVVMRAVNLSTNKMIPCHTFSDCLGQGLRLHVKDSNYIVV